MIIGIDAASLAIADETRRGGVYRFSYNLLLNLFKVDRNNNYLLYSYAPLPRDFSRHLPDNVTVKIIKPEIGYSVIGLSREMFLHKPDVFISLSQAVPYYHPAKNIVFIHDLGFLRFPKLYLNTYKRLVRITRLAVKSADMLVAVSQSTKNELLDLYQSDKDKVEVVLHGSDHIGYQKKEAASSILKKYNISTPFFLYVGNIKPNKNIGRLLAAYRYYCHEMKNPAALVLVGKETYRDMGITDALANIPENGKAVLTGFIPDNDLNILYSKASAFVSPAIYEGYGLPIVEAMAHGVPVITSDTSSMKELGEGSALLVNPFNTEDITKALCSISTDIKLVKKLSQSGFKKIRQLKWNNSARKLLEIINKI